tara:strand:+ start:81813 stop:82376 length:564 start_codon:yes stop_codon:yes gene_type:complete
MFLGGIGFMLFGFIGSMAMDYQDQILGLSFLACSLFCGYIFFFQLFCFVMNKPADVWVASENGFQLDQGFSWVLPSQFEWNQFKRGVFADTLLLDGLDQPQRTWNQLILYFDNFELTGLWRFLALGDQTIMQLPEGLAIVVTYPRKDKALIMEKITSLSANQLEIQDISILDLTQEGFPPAPHRNAG